MVQVVYDGKQLFVRSDKGVVAGGASGHLRATDLFLGSIGACMGLLLVDRARELKLPLERVVAELKDVVAEDPIRIRQVEFDLTIEGDLSTEEAQQFVRTWEQQCKISNTLRHLPEVTLRVHAAEPRQGGALEVETSGSSRT